MTARHFNNILINSSMATRAKYDRVKTPEEKNENKLDTDIIMRFSDTYGKDWLIQVDTSHVLLLFSLEREKHSSPSRLLRS